MKKLMLFSIVVALSMSTFAQNIFFPTKEGTTLLYSNLNDKGKVESYTQQTVVKVEGSGSDFSISYIAQMLDSKRKPMADYPMEVPYNITISKGILTMDMKSFAAPGTEGFIDIEGDKIKIPSSLAPGDKLEDVNFTLTVNMGFSIKTQIGITDQKCLSVEEVTVQAGTFQCYKLTQSSKATVMGREVVTKIFTWYAHNIGIIKSETYDNKDKLQSSVELFSISN